MATIPEQLSNINANSQGKPDSNLAQDANNLGGLPAEDFATKEYVKQYHGTRETEQNKQIDEKIKSALEESKEFTNSQIRNQDFSHFSKDVDLIALDKKLQQKIIEGDNAQKEYTNAEIANVVKDANANFDDVKKAMGTINGRVTTLENCCSEVKSNIKTINEGVTNLDGKYDELFQSVSDGKNKIAGAITDKGVITSATDTFENMATNIRAIPTSSSGGSGGESDIPSGYFNTTDATATPYDILTGKTAYGITGKIEGVLTINESTGQPSYNVGSVEKVYGTLPGKLEEKIINKSWSYDNSFDNDSSPLVGMQYFGYDAVKKKETTDNLIYVHSGITIKSNGKTISHTFTELGLDIASNSSNKKIKIFKVFYMNGYFNFIIATGTTLYIYKIIENKEDTGNSLILNYYDIDVSSKVTIDINGLNSHCSIAKDLNNTERDIFAISSGGAGRICHVIIFEVLSEVNENNIRQNKSISILSEFDTVKYLTTNSYWYQFTTEIFFATGIEKVICIYTSCGRLFNL